MIRLLSLILVLFAIVRPASAVELVMVRRDGCHYCIAWTNTIGPAYPNTEMGQFAPLRRVDIADLPASEIELDGKVLFTPTFVLVHMGKELGRIEGNPGEDFFWPLLYKLLSSEAGYEGSM